MVDAASSWPPRPSRGLSLTTQLFRNNGTHLICIITEHVQAIRSGLRYGVDVCQTRQVTDSPTSTALMDSKSQPSVSGLALDGVFVRK